MDDSIRWSAVENRDARFDGEFVFAVATTGVYCRPSCSSRRARRENVRFFGSNADAEDGGFRACRRCKPDTNKPGPATELADEITADPTLSASDPTSDVAWNEGITSAHLQRKFKNEVGVSVKRFADAQRVGRFKEVVAAGAPVTDAIYAAGYGSSSRLYESAGEKLGMTPAAYKKGGVGVSIRFAVADCEFGKILAARTERGVCSVAFGDSEAGLETDLRAEFPNAEISRDDAGLAATISGVIARLNGKPVSNRLPLDVRATAFQIRVWDELTKIPYGETVSYSDVAERLGDRKKVRAVARACATNDVAIVIPCHRVVASDGKLSGYRWGLERKRALLEKEHNNAEAHG